MGAKISAVLITKNEEAVIGRCLKSLLGVDEMVILDTGSTDRTVEIANGLGAKVTVRSSPIIPFHFAQARNEALGLASNDWILTIDADEVMRPGGMRKVRKAIEDRPDITAILTTFIDQATGGTHTTSIRKSKFFKASEWNWKYRVHEQLVAKNPEKPVGLLENVCMEHLPVPDKSVRHGQNIELLKLCVKENPEYTRAFRHLGQELMLRKEWTEAIPYLAEYTEKTQEGPLDKSQGALQIGRCYVESGKIDEGLHWFDLANTIDPRRREPFYHAALNLIKACRLEDAIVYVKKMLAIPVTAKPNSNVDLEGAWDGTAIKMLTFCTGEIARAKAEFQAKNA